MIGAVTRITKEDFASTILMFGLCIELVGVIVFFRWYNKARVQKKLILKTPLY